MGKPHLTEDQVEALREQLIRERADILSELADDENILNENADYVEDSGELAFGNLDKEIISKLSFKQKETLKKIDKALQKMEEGVYGKCEKCGDNIFFERLDVLPYTGICKDCLD